MFQVQGDKEKLLYELDTLQAELEKCNMSSSRLQKEKEDAYADIDRGREKYEKLQVSSLLVSVSAVFHHFSLLTPPSIETNGVVVQRCD